MAVDGILQRIACLSHPEGFDTSIDALQFFFNIFFTPITPGTRVGLLPLELT